MFVGKNLTNIRILHGYTRKQLADKLQISEQSVWQYENGYTSPKLEVVTNLKQIFRVKNKYFYSEDILDKDGQSNIQQHHIAYRSGTTYSNQKTQSEAKHVEFVSATLRIFEAKIQYPVNELVVLRENIIKLINESKQNRNEIIREVAAKAREMLEIDEKSNKNLMFMLEKKGVFIFEKAIGEKIDAYSLWSEDDRPFIILGNLKKSAARRNFDLAHELGHLLLHYKVEFSSLDSGEYKEHEQEANMFASAFLLPEEQFIEDFNSLPKNRRSNPDYYIELKKKWTVSIQAMAYRAHSLELIDYQKYRYFNIQVNKRGYKVREPLDTEIKIVRPGKVRSILELLLDRNHFNLSALLEDVLKVEGEFVSDLLGIEVDFLNKYLIKNDPATTYSFSNLNLKAK